jgi:hypothetical protein
VPLCATFFLPVLSDQPREFNDPQDGWKADGAEIPSLCPKLFMTFRIGDGAPPKKRQKAPESAILRERKKTQD